MVSTSAQAAELSDTNDAARTVVSKAEYARMRGRSASAVSHWIRHGKLFGAALQGSGTRAKIVVEHADQQLAELLDVGQQSAQAHPLRLPLAGPDTTLGQNGTSQSDYYTARARKQRAEAALAEAKLQASEGAWLDRADVEAATARMITEINRLVDELPKRLGEAVAAELGVEARALVLALRRETRRIRADWAARFEESDDNRE